jgi:hypothetical protein
VGCYDKKSKVSALQLRCSVEDDDVQKTDDLSVTIAAEYRKLVERVVKFSRTASVVCCFL